MFSYFIASKYNIENYTYSRYAICFYIEIAFYFQRKWYFSSYLGTKLQRHTHTHMRTHIFIKCEQLENIMA